MTKKQDKLYTSVDIEYIQYVSAYKAIKEYQEDFNSMPLWDRIWLAIKGYEL